jgi:hypothetical protein
MADRGVHLPFLVDLESSLITWQAEERDSNVLVAIDALVPSVERCRRAAAAALGPRLFNHGSPVQFVMEQSSSENADWPHIPSDEECALVAQSLQLDTMEGESLAKFCRKMLAVKECERMRLKNGGVDIIDDLQDQGRSVRTL